MLTLKPFLAPCLFVHDGLGQFADMKVKHTCSKNDLASREAAEDLMQLLGHQAKESPDLLEFNLLRDVEFLDQGTAKGCWEEPGDILIVQDVHKSRAEGVAVDRQLEGWTSAKVILNWETLAVLAVS